MRHYRDRGREHPSFDTNAYDHAVSYPMRNISSLLILSAVVCCALPASADTLPKRQAGMWEVSISPGKGLPPMSTKQCVDEATDAKMMEMGNDATRSMGSSCSKNEFKKTASGFETSAECKTGSSTMVSRGVFTGDFTTAYSGEVTTSFTPPLYGQSASTINISAKFLGACTDGLKPGDILLPNGQKTSVDQAAAQAKQAAEMFKNGNLFKNGGGLDAAAQKELMGNNTEELDPEAMKMIQNAMKQLGE